MFLVYSRSQLTAQKHIWRFFIHWEIERKTPGPSSCLTMARASMQHAVTSRASLNDPAVVRGNMKSVVRGMCNMK